MVVVTGGVGFRGPVVGSGGRWGREQYPRLGEAREVVGVGVEM